MKMIEKTALAMLLTLLAAAPAFAGSAEKQALSDEQKRSTLEECVQAAGDKSPAREWLKAFHACAHDRSMSVRISQGRKASKKTGSPPADRPAK